jgi:hypothetical protein
VCNRRYLLLFAPRRSSLSITLLRLDFAGFEASQRRKSFRLLAREASSGRLAVDPP